MRVHCYPSNSYAVGHYRVIWPAQAARAAGLDVKVADPGNRRGVGGLETGGAMADAWLGEPADVAVFQRPTSRQLAQAIPLLRRKGTAVVVDLDDDLTCIDPANPAYAAHHPRRNPDDNWNWLKLACREATLVTVSTPELLRRFAPHGRGVVLENAVPRALLDVERRDWTGDRPRVGWAGSLHSHPRDLEVIGDAVKRSGLPFQTVGDPAGVGELLGVGAADGTGPLGLMEWHRAISGRMDVGLAPLADTKFNRAKSWLKPLEYAALGVPCVASDTPEYLRFAATSDLGICVGRKHWLLRLEQLRDPGLRQDMSERSRDAVKRLHTIEGNAHLWAEAWAMAHDHGP